VQGLEIESYKNTLKMDNEHLSNQFEKYKLDTLEEKRRLGEEYQV
jgi:hypothetical protein